MKRSADDEIIDDIKSEFYSAYTFYRLVSRFDMLNVFKDECKNDEFFIKTISDVFVESFVVVDKFIYNKSVVNTLFNVGLVNSVGVCLIRRLVRLIICISYKYYLISKLIGSCMSLTHIWIILLQSISRNCMESLRNNSLILRPVS
jgi:hypothetical protein